MIIIYFLFTSLTLNWNQSRRTNIGVGLSTICFVQRCSSSTHKLVNGGWSYANNHLQLDRHCFYFYFIFLLLTIFCNRFAGFYLYSKRMHCKFLPLFKRSQLFSQIELHIFFVYVAINAKWFLSANFCYIFLNKYIFSNNCFTKLKKM